jgi:tetratricopeptide (TPR) repeat protein
MNHTDSRAFLVLSGIYNSTGAFRNALACSYAAIRFEPSLVDAYVEAGISFRCMGLHYDAARVLRKALAIKPDSGAAYWQLALTYYYSGDLSSALEICQALKSINPGLSRRLFAGLVRY